jgi:3-(3-hydroxy-phenyl)propionate hydroxylase
MPRSAWSAFGLQAAFRLLSVAPPARNYFAEMKYKPKPRFDAGFLAGGNKHGAAALIGRLFPQPTVRSVDRAGLLDDFLGDDFALVTLPQTPPSLFGRLPADLWAALKLKRVAIRAAGDGAPVPNGVTSVSDVDGEFSRWAKNIPSGLALIRPDRYVAAFLPTEDLDAGIREVEELISQASKPA